MMYVQPCFSPILQILPNWHLRLHIAQMHVTPNSQDGTHLLDQPYPNMCSFFYTSSHRKLPPSSQLPMAVCIGASPGFNPPRAFRHYSLVTLPGGPYKPSPSLLPETVAQWGHTLFHGAPTQLSTSTHGAGLIWLLSHHSRYSFLRSPVSLLALSLPRRAQEQLSEDASRVNMALEASHDLGPARTPAACLRHHLGPVLPKYSHSWEPDPARSHFREGFFWFLSQITNLKYLKFIKGILLGFSPTVNVHILP